jgi:hypothetical protein
MLFLIEKWQHLCKKKQFTNLKIRWKERHLLLTRESKMTMRKRQSRNKSNLKKEKMKKKGLNFYKCKKQKK